MDAFSPTQAIQQEPAPLVDMEDDSGVKWKGSQSNIRRITRVVGDTTAHGQWGAWSTAVPSPLWNGIPGSEIEAKTLNLTSGSATRRQNIRPSRTGSKLSASSSKSSSTSDPSSPFGDPASLLNVLKSVAAQLNDSSLDTPNVVLHPSAEQNRPVRGVTLRDALSSNFERPRDPSSRSRRGVSDQAHQSGSSSLAADDPSGKCRVRSDNNLRRPTAPLHPQDDFSTSGSDGSMIIDSDGSFRSSASTAPSSVDPSPSSLAPPPVPRIKHPVNRTSSVKGDVSIPSVEPASFTKNSAQCQPPLQRKPNPPPTRVPSTSLPSIQIGSQLPIPLPTQPTQPRALGMRRPHILRSNSGVSDPFTKQKPFKPPLLQPHPQKSNTPQVHPHSTFSTAAAATTTITNVLTHKQPKTTSQPDLPTANDPSSPACRTDAPKQHRPSSETKAKCAESGIPDFLLEDSDDPAELPMTIQNGGPADLNRGPDSSFDCPPFDLDALEVTMKQYD